MLIQDFLKMNKIPELPVQKGKGRMFADVHIAGVGSQRLFFSEACDLSKPMYVNEGTHGVLWVGNNTGAPIVGKITV